MRYPQMPHIPYHIQSHNERMILIGIRFESYINVLLYSSCMFIKNILSILIAMTNVKDLGPCRDALFGVFDVIVTIVDASLIISLLIMDIQMVIISQLCIMYVIIYLFCFDSIWLLRLFAVYGKLDRSFSRGDNVCVLIIVCLFYWF